MLKKKLIIQFFFIIFFNCKILCLFKIYTFKQLLFIKNLFLL